MLTAAPEIDVWEESSYTNVYDDATSIDFGCTNLGTTLSRTFQISNDGGGELTLDSDPLSLPDGSSLASGFDETVPAWSSTSFTVQLDATSVGTYSGRANVRRGALANTSSR